MLVLGLESSCDECAAAVVEDGRRIRSSVVATQIPFHAVYKGVVPEIASRIHAEWVGRVAANAMEEAGIGPADIDAVAVSSRPGLAGSLLVGLNFAKAFSWARGIPYVAIDHMLAHLYAARLVEELPYPYLGLLVSGGHSVICRVDDFDRVEVLGASIDDAVGEAFDKVAKHYDFGYPGGMVIDRLAEEGNPDTFRFPLPNLYKGDHRYDVSYSGLKNAVINHLEKYRVGEGEASPQNIAASFRRTAIDILLRAIYRAVDDTGIKTLVAGGGVAANSLLRRELATRRDLRVVFPPLNLCGPNRAMVGALGYEYLKRGDVSPLEEPVSARVAQFKRQRAPGSQAQ